LGKNYARLLASIDTTTVVVPDEEHNSKPENMNSENIYISGDNLDGLKHLLKSYSRQVKCIYIDIILQRLIQFNYIVLRGVQTQKGVCRVKVEKSRLFFCVKKERGY